MLIKVACGKDCSARNRLHCGWVDPVCLRGLLHICPENRTAFGCTIYCAWSAGFCVSHLHVELVSVSCW